MGEYNISIFNIATSISKIADLVDSQLTGHHRRVAYISGRIAEELGVSDKEYDEVILAAFLHDIGGLSTQERIEALDFSNEDRNGHAERGYKLLSLFKPFDTVAKIVRKHHDYWTNGISEWDTIGGNIVYMADRIDALIVKNKNILTQTNHIREYILSESGELFMPKLVDIFLKLSKNESFWLDSINEVLIQPKSDQYRGRILSQEEMIELGLFFSQIIDFRCHFTATHSSGIAAVSSELARLKGFNQRDCILMRFAGYVHDIGKLAVPTEIIEKPGKLTEEETRIMKMHTYYTYQILDEISGLEEVKEWAAYHHEKIDGTGYPFGIKGEAMSEGCKIMKVADIFTALTEERPYRAAMKKEEVLTIFSELHENDEELENIIELLKDNYSALDKIRAEAQAEAIKNYQVFIGEHIE